MNDTEVSSTEKDVSLEGVRLPTSVRKQLRKTRETLKRKKEGGDVGTGTGSISGAKSGARRKKNKTIHKIGLRGVFTEQSHSNSQASRSQKQTTTPQLLRKIKSSAPSNPHSSIPPSSIPPSSIPPSSIPHSSIPPSSIPPSSIPPSSIPPSSIPPSSVALPLKTSSYPSQAPIKRNPSKGILKTSGRATTRKRVRFQDESGAIMPTPFPIPKRLRFTQKRRVHGEDEPIKLNPIVPRERTIQIVDGGGDNVFVEGEDPEILGETLDIKDVLTDAEEIPREELQSRLRKRGVYVQSSTPPDLLKRLNVITADVPEGGIQRTG